jgi:hypothetical protein
LFQIITRVQISINQSILRYELNYDDEEWKFRKQADGNAELDEKKYICLRVGAMDDNKDKKMKITEGKITSEFDLNLCPGGDNNENLGPGAPFFNNEGESVTLKQSDVIAAIKQKELKFVAVEAGKYGSDRPKFVFELEGGSVAEGYTFKLTFRAVRVICQGRKFEGYNAGQFASKSAASRVQIIR